MATALITRPSVGGTERFVAGVTRHPFSGLTSWVGAPGDGAKRVARWVWGDGVGWTANGAVVQRSFPAPGTYTLTLTVYGDDGTTGTANVAVVVVAPPAWPWDKHVASLANGGDDAGGHDGSGALPWLTVNHAFSDWRGGGVIGTGWGRLRARGGDSVAWAGTFPSSPDFGPFYFTRELAGANPVALVPDDAEVQLGESGHDVGAELSHPLVYDGVDLAWPTPQNADGPSSRGNVKGLHPFCSFANGVVTNASLVFQDEGCVLFGSTVQFSDDVGIGQSGGHGFFVVDTCTAKGNGVLDSIHDVGPADHQGYVTAANDVGVLDSTFDQAGAVALSGLKLDGVTRAAVHRCTSKNCTYGLDPSGNVGNQVQDLVIDAHVIDGAQLQGLSLNYCNRVSIRNLRVISSPCTAQLIRERSYNNTDTGGAGNQIAQNVDILGLSANKIDGVFVEFTTSLWQSWHVENCAVVKTGDGPFFVVQNAADLVQLTVDHNRYWRAGGTDGTNNFALVGGVAKTFAQWQALVFAATGGEVNSAFADPKFGGNRDLTLQNASPCLDTGATLRVLEWDAIGAHRPVGGAYDIGALEQVSPTYFPGVSVGVIAGLSATDGGGSMEFAGGVGAAALAPWQAHAVSTGGGPTIVVRQDTGGPAQGDDLVTRVATALADLFPPGRLYKPASEGTLAELRRALASEGAELRDRARYLLDVELNPAKTLELLPDWERWYGLPDAAVAAVGPQTVAQRRAAVLGRVRAIGGQSRAYFVAVALTLGFEVEIEEFDRSRIGQKVGSPILVGDWEFVWKVHAPWSTVHHARAGASFAGDRVGTFGNELLEAFLRELTPAHTVVLFAYDLGRPAAIGTSIMEAALLTTREPSVGEFAEPDRRGSELVGGAAGLLASPLLQADDFAFTW